MRALSLAVLLLAGAATANAESYQCTYAWPDNPKPFEMRLDVTQSTATMTAGRLSVEFRVAANSDRELLLFTVFTKANSGESYPVGFTTIALDKSTWELTYSNSFAGGDQSNHAYGTCTLAHH